MSKNPKNSRDKNIIWQFLIRKSTITGFTFISIAFFFTLLIFFAAAQWGPEPRNDNNEPICENPPEGVLMCKILNSKLLEPVQNFSVIFTACFFIIETFERNKRKYREAWSLIDGARESETSGARVLALQELHQDRISLKGLDAEKADLIGINLKEAILEKANLKCALLINSNLEGADLRNSQLQKAQFQKANLQYARLEGSIMIRAELVETKLQYANLRAAKLQCANLKKTQLENAILRSAKLQGAFLRETQFQGADLSDADFRGADLFRANFNKANIKNADFRGTNLKLEQVMNKAKHWEEAKYGIDFAPELNDFLNREEYSADEWESQVKKEDEDDYENLKNLIMLAIKNDSIRKTDISRIEHKINIALGLLNGNKPVHNEDTYKIEAIVTDVVEEVIQKKSYTQDSKTQLRKELQDLQDINDSARDELRERLEFNIQASEWLKIRCETLKNLGIKEFLLNKNEIDKTGKIIDETTVEKYLKNDIKCLLEKLIESLASHKEIEDVYISIDEINIKSSNTLCLKVLKIILEDVIPKILETEKVDLPHGVLKQIKTYLFIFRNKLSDMI